MKDVITWPFRNVVIAINPAIARTGVCRVRGDGPRALRELSRRVMAAAGGRTYASGAEFTIRCDGPIARVTCLRGRVHVAAVRAVRAVRAAGRGHRPDQRRATDDTWLRRPAARRLRGSRRAASAGCGRPASRVDRVRRQGGLSRRVQRASRARSAGASSRGDAPLRAAVDLTGERGRAVGRAPAVVPQAAPGRERTAPKAAQALTARRRDRHAEQRAGGRHISAAQHPAGGHRAAAR